MIQSQGSIWDLIVIVSIVFLGSLFMGWLSARILDVRRGRLRSLAAGVIGFFGGLALLALQIQADQLDPQKLAEVDDLRIGLYNRMLKAQAAELDRQIEALVAPFASSLGQRVGKSLKPETVLKALQDDVASLRRAVRQVTMDLACFRDPLNLKAWLKSLRITRGRQP